MHAGTRHAQIKLKKSPKPTETRISQNEKNQKNHNLQTIFARETKVSTRTSRQTCKKSSQQKKTILDQNGFSATASPKTCTQRAENRDGTTKQTFTQFLAAMIELGRSQPMWER